MNNMSCGLDLGSSTIKACLLKGDQLLGFSEVPAHGLEGAAIKDLHALSAGIHQVLTGLRKNSGCKFREVFLGVGGHFCSSRTVTTALPLTDHGSKVITFADIKKIRQQSRLLGLKVDEDVIDDFPHYFVVDENNKAVNPLGLQGRKLETSALLIVMAASRLNNVMKAVQESGFDPIKLYVSAYAAAQTYLSDAQKREGCLFLDMGASGTDCLFFKDGQLREMKTIPFGGRDLTESILRHMQLSFAAAEDVKRSYACAVDEDNNEEDILIKKEETFVPTKKKVIAAAIEQKMTDFFESLQSVLSQSSLAGHLNAGIVVSGGQSLIPGALERLEQMTRLPVAMVKMPVLKEATSQSALFSAAYALAKSGRSLMERPRAHPKGNLPFLSRISFYFRELYQEYF